MLCRVGLLDRAVRAYATVRCRITRSILLSALIAALHDARDTVAIVF
jgi:hypothetical protein